MDYMLVQYRISVVGTKYNNSSISEGKKKPNVRWVDFCWDEVLNSHSL